MKTTQVYEADIYGSKAYFSHDYAGLRAAQRMAQILGIHFSLVVVKVGVSKVTIS